MHNGNRCKGCPSAEVGRSLLAGQGGACRAEQMSHFHRLEKTWWCRVSWLQFKRLKFQLQEEIVQVAGLMSCDSLSNGMERWASPMNLSSKLVMQCRSLELLPRDLFPMTYLTRFQLPEV
jgi:hypothetical protein